VVRTGGSSGSARDWVNVADGHGDDTVICGSSLSTVYVDPGDQVKGNCGRVIRSAPAGDAG
jgi:hypothetical protein